MIQCCIKIFKTHLSMVQVTQKNSSPKNSVVIIYSAIWLSSFKESQNVFFFFFFEEYNDHFFNIMKVNHNQGLSSSKK